MTSFKVALPPRSRSRCRSSSGSSGGSSRPAFEETARSVVAMLVVAATFLFVAGASFAYWVVLPSAIAFLLDFDSELYRHPDPRAATTTRSWRRASVGMGTRLRAAHHHPRPRSPRDHLTPRSCGATAASASCSASSSRVLLPGVDPVTTPSRRSRCSCSSRRRSGSRPSSRSAGPRQIAARREASRRAPSTSVSPASTRPTGSLPVEGEPVRDGGVAVAAAGSSRSARRTTSRASGAASTRRDRPRLRQRALPPRVRGLRGLRRRAAVRRPGSRSTSSGRPARLDGDAVAIARLGAAECLRSGSTTVADASFTGAAAPACDELGPARARLPRGLRRRPGRRARRASRSRASAIAASLSDRVRLGVSPHAPYSVTRGRLRGAAPGSGFPSRRTSPRARPSRSGSSTAPGLMAEARAARRAGRRDRRSASSPARACSARPSSRRTASTWSRGDRAPRRARRGGRPLPALERACSAAAPRPLRRAARCRRPRRPGHRQPRVDAVVRPVRGDADRGLTARVRERRADALTRERRRCELATLGSARALGLDDRDGLARAGKRADLTVVSLAGSPFLPWEEPTTAVVFGGSPERVLLTLVDGEVRYEEGGFEWHDLRRSASAARGRLLSEAPPAPKT